MKQLLTLILLLLLIVMPSAAQERMTPEQLSSFARLPILHEGRIKPLDSFARLHYQAVTGQKTGYDNRPSPGSPKLSSTPPVPLSTNSFYCVTMMPSVGLGYLFVTINSIISKSWSRPCSSKKSC
jgi:hypothetical protein